MARYYFDFHVLGDVSLDTIGTLLADTQAAKAEAAVTAAEWLCDHASENGAELIVSVRQGKVAPLFTVTAVLKFNEEGPPVVSDVTPR